MSLSLEERLSVERHRRFGRQHEVELFQSAIQCLTARSTSADVELRFHVLHIFGPGGVDKTTLLWEFAQICREAETSAIYLDARNIEPSPESFLGRLQFAMGLISPDSPLQVFAPQLGHHVLLVDTYQSS